MIVFDLINDEAPLFIEAAKSLPSFDNVKENILFITEGNRWKKRCKQFTTKK